MELSARTRIKYTLSTRFLYHRIMLRRFRLFLEDLSSTSFLSKHWKNARVKILAMVYGWEVKSIKNVKTAIKSLEKLDSKCVRSQSQSEKSLN